jgi:hypothetical protein
VASFENEREKIQKKKPPASPRGLHGEVVSGSRDARSPASSIFLMISTLYTLLAHFRSFGSDGTSFSISSNFTAAGGGDDAGRRKYLTKIRGDISVAAARTRGRRDAIDAAAVVAGASRDREIGEFARDRASFGANATWVRARRGRGRRRVSREEGSREKKARACFSPATSRQHIATSCRLVFGTFTLLRTRSCGGENQRYVS